MLNQHATSHDGGKHEVLEPIDDTRSGLILNDKTVTKCQLDVKPPNKAELDDESKIGYTIYNDHDTVAEHSMDFIPETPNAREL